MTGRWIAGLVVAVLGLTGSGQCQEHYAITARQVAIALSAKGISISDKQVSLLAKVVATEPNPALDVLSVEPMDNSDLGSQSETRSQVKIGCHVSGACIPFYALVSSPKKTAANGPGASATSTASAIAGLKANSAITMKVGAHATLVMDDGRSHIEVSVVSLQSGAAGHLIRVASSDRKQIYIGEVMSPNLLKRSY